jgi:hypothetical protein
MISFFIEIPFYIVCIDECIRPSDSRRISKTHSMRCRQVVSSYLDGGDKEIRLFASTITLPIYFAIIL